MEKEGVSPNQPTLLTKSPLLGKRELWLWISVVQSGNWPEAFFLFLWCSMVDHRRETAAPSQYYVYWHCHYLEKYLNVKLWDFWRWQKNMHQEGVEVQICLGARCSYWLSLCALCVVMGALTCLWESSDSPLTGCTKGLTQPFWGCIYGGKVAGGCLEK